MFTCILSHFGGCVTVSAISGTFASIEGQTFNNGTEMWDVVYTPSGVDLVAVPAQNVPEPSLFMLAGIGLAGIAYVTEIRTPKEMKPLTET